MSININHIMRSVARATEKKAKQKNVQHEVQARQYAGVQQVQKFDSDNVIIKPSTVKLSEEQVLERYRTTILNLALAYLAKRKVE